MNYHVFEDYNIPFDEKGSTVGTVRKIQWVKEGAEPDESKAKVEIRKMYIGKDGVETTGKGYSFSTPEGPSELVQGLIDAGFGDTREILRSVRKRDDFLKAAEEINVDYDDSEEDGEMFDMRQLMLPDDDFEEAK
jgi:hypothetical protein